MSHARNTIENRPRNNGGTSRAKWRPALLSASGTRSAGVAGAPLGYHLTMGPPVLKNGCVNRSTARWGLPEYAGEVRTGVKRFTVKL